jgi:hypothetical protein
MRLDCNTDFTAGNAAPELDGGDEAMHRYDPEHLRAFLAEQAWSIAVTANIMQDYLELRDRPGAAYAARCLGAYAKSITAAMEILLSIEGGHS